MDVFTAASHDEVLQLVIQVALLLAAARVLGELSQRLGQPAVVGEILAGVVLGPSLLSSVIPAVGDWIIPQTAVQGHLLEVVSLIGVMMLLVLTGLETDLNMIRRRAGTSLGVSAGGLVVTFSSGLVLGFLLPERLLGDPSARTVFALFVATALAISAIAVLAKVLMDLDLMRRDIGQTMLASAMIDDITGWTLLGLITALASAEAIGAGIVLTTVGTVVLFILLTGTVGSWMVRRGVEVVQNRMESRDRMLTLVIVLAFAWGAVTQALNLEPVIGAFAIGILFGRVHRLPADVTHKLEGVTLGVFAPIFFAVAGLKVDITSIMEPSLLLITLLVIGVATVGKVVGVYLGARFLSGQDHWTALAYGSGLNARGAVEIIIATIGLSLGILSQEMFSMIVVMAVVTSMLAPMALRATLARVTIGDEEQERLRHEKARAGAFTASLRSVLVPVRPRAEPTGDAQVLGGALLARLGETSELSITLYSSTDRSQRQVAADHLSSLRGLFDENATVNTRLTVDEDPVAGILREVARDYDLLVLGAPELSPTPTSLFGPMIDDLVKLAPCPTVVVRGLPDADDWPPAKIVVPTTGSTASRNAAQLAFALAGEETTVTGIHVVTPTSSVGSYAQVGGQWDRHVLAREMTSEMEALGASLSVATASDIREADDAEDGILAAVADVRADLLVIGTSVRAGTARLFLGHRVEYLVRNAPCPVLILNT